MRFLVILTLAMLSFVAHGAMVPFTAPRGTNGITVVSNVSQGVVIIDGQGLTTNFTALIAAESNMVEGFTFLIDGTSLDTQTATPAGAGNAWPDFLLTNGPWRHLRVYTNAARGGRWASAMGAEYGTNLRPWILNKDGQRDYRSWQGLYYNGGPINDITTDGKSGEFAFAAVMTNLWNANRDGLKTIAITIPTNAFFGYADPNFNARRVVYNGLIRQHRHLYDHLFDWDLLYATSPTNDSVFIDGIHYNASNNLWIARNIYSNISPFRPMPLKERGAYQFTNQFDGVQIGRAWIGNYPPLASTFGYTYIGLESDRSNTVAPTGLVLPIGGDNVFLNSFSGMTFRLGGVSYAGIDSGGAFNVFGGASGFKYPTVNDGAKRLLQDVNGSGVADWTNFIEVAGIRLPTAEAYWDIVVRPGTETLAITNAFNNMAINLGVNDGQRGTIYGAMYATNFGLLYADEMIATNSTVNSNIMVNLDFGARNLFLTNNISLTNFILAEAGFKKSVEYRLTPVGHNRTVVYPTLGGAQFGVRIFTNANNPVWTTLTNGSTYRLVISSWFTNLDFAISEWK